jgi:hypothetical protein
MMLYAPLAVKRLGAAVFVLPAYAAEPTRRERVSRRGPSGAGERVARALTQGRCLTGVDVLLSTSVSATDYPQPDRVTS